jgi:c-di-GMP-related signal transduction protein
MELFLARQPIFDRQLQVYAYELLYRSSERNQYDSSDGTLASLQVLSTSLFSFGLQKVADGKGCFLNLDRDLLLSGCEWLMPAQHFILEVLETVPRDEAIITACLDLRSQGYRLALDDFEASMIHDPLLETADIVKVDFRRNSREQIEMLSRHLKYLPLTLLAEKVETQEEFEWARKLGFHYFQGYFFARPVMLRSKQIPGFKLNYLRILQEVYRSELNLERLTHLIKQEISLSHRLLRYVNSAAFNFRNRLHSIHDALVMLGENEIRKWVSLAALPCMASDKPVELVVNSMVRARFCELLAGVMAMPRHREDLFLAGIFSHLDAMMGRPLEELLDEIVLPEPVRGALYQRPEENNPIADVYALVLAYEAADWPLLEQRVSKCRLTGPQVTEAYREAVDWASKIYQQAKTL